MLSTKSVTPLPIKLHPSRRLLLLITGLYTGAFGSLLMLSGVVWIKWLLLMIVPLSYLVSLNRIGWFNRWNARFPVVFRLPITALQWREDGEFELYLVDVNHVSHAQQVITAQLLPSTTVLPWITVLNFSCVQQPWYQRRRSLVLLADSVDAEDFRRLRVHLLTQSQPPADNAAE